MQMKMIEKSIYNYSANEQLRNHAIIFKSMKEVDSFHYLKYRLTHTSKHFPKQSHDFQLHVAVFIRFYIVRVFLLFMLHAISCLLRKCE